MFLRKILAGICVISIILCSGLLLALEGVPFNQEQLRIRVLDMLQKSYPRLDTVASQLEFVNFDSALDAIDQKQITYWNLEVPEQVSLVGTVTLPVKLIINRKRELIIRLGAKINPVVSVYCPREDIQPGHILKPEDLEARSFPLNRVSYTALVLEPVWPEMESRVTLRAGVPVLSWMIGPRTLVYRNSDISIEVVRDNVEIEVKGLALQSGSRDEMIRVKPFGSDKILLAKVLDSNTVLIEDI